MYSALIGQAMLWLALLASLGAAAFSAAGIVRARPAWLRLGRTLVLVAFSFATVASAVLVVALLSDNFAIEYVAERSARAMPSIYKLGAWWGGQEGSLLFWLWLLLGYAALLVTGRPDVEAPRLWPAATAVMAGVAVFFAWLVAVVENPFRILSPPPPDGVGLNPLLQSPSMLLHPVALYLGYVGITVPFAFAAAALALGDRTDAWVRVTRRWALVAWFFLGLGIILGGEWAYKELGWGGYWAWDPVENSSLIPWLLGTALVHSGLAQERKGTLRRWNAALAIAIFVTVLLGTFLTRSGVLASVHAFAESPTGPYFLAFTGLVTGSGVWLLIRRWETLEDRQPVASLVSREGVFFGGNLVLVSLAFAVLFGTLVPIFTRMFGPGITVQAPYFERVSSPLFVLVLVLMGLGLALPWQPQRTPGGAGRPSWVTQIAAPAGTAVVFAALLALGGLRQPSLLLGFFAAFLAGAAALAGLVREVRAHLRRSSPPRVWTWRRMGALLAHGGIAVMAVAILASTAFQVETSRSLALGESAHLAGYTVRFDGLDLRRVPGATEVYARVSLFRGDRFIRQLEPARRVYDGNMAEFGATTEVALHRHPEGDVYVALAGWEENGRRAAFELYVNPLVSWLWIGSSLMLLGTVLALGCAAEVRALEPQARVRVLEQASRLSAAPSSGAALAQPTPGVR